LKNEYLPIIKRGDYIVNKFQQSNTDEVNLKDVNIDFECLSELEKVMKHYFVKKYSTYERLTKDFHIECFWKTQNILEKFAKEENIYEWRFGPLYRYWKKEICVHTEQDNLDEQEQHFLFDLWKIENQQFTFLNQNVATTSALLVLINKFFEKWPQVEVASKTINAVKWYWIFPIGLDTKIVLEKINIDGFQFLDEKHKNYLIFTPDGLHKYPIAEIKKTCEFIPDYTNRECEDDLFRYSIKKIFPILKTLYKDFKKTKT
jgi:hypothetical protein